MAQRLKKDDKVIVIAGRDKGREGRVLRVIHERDRVLVEGINVVKRHTKPTPQNPEGGIIEKEMPIHVSNVMLADANGKPTRVRHRTDEDGVKHRVAVTTGDALEN